MDNRANVEQAVFDFVRPVLKRHREETADLARAAKTSVAKVNQHAEDVVTQRRRELKRAQDELQDCLGREGADCSGYRRRVELCERALERAIQGRAMIRQASSRFQQQQSKYNLEMEQLVLRAEKIVRSADDRTSSYQQASQYSPSTTFSSARVSSRGSWDVGGPPTLASGPGSPTDGDAASHSSDSTGAPSTGWRDLPGVSVPPHFPENFALIPIELIVNDNPVRGAQDFDSGQNLPELRWSTEALLDVVLPSMAMSGDPRKYIQERDDRENLSGGRSYSATYSGFFSPSSAIHLRVQSDGRLDLVNGRHRLWLLSRAGAKTVPALIDGGHG